MIMREFHLSAILTAYSGILLCKMEKVYEILDYMTGDSNFTHQLPRAHKEVKPFLEEQLPFLKKITIKEMKTEAVNTFMMIAIAEYGEYHVLTPIPPHAHAKIDPITEFINIREGCSHEG